MKILIVDDELDILNILSYTLEKQGFEVTTANSGSAAITALKNLIPDLIILDVMMPGMDGIEVCQQIRQNSLFDNTIITFLTARGEDFSQIAGLDSGADDYITKPIKPVLLVSRVNALLRRKHSLNETQSSSEVIVFGNLTIDRQKYEVSIEGEIQHLPKKEFELLFLLASKPNFVFERDYILSSIWGTDIVVGDRTIDVHVRKLREKIGADYIKTVKGIGYKFVFE